LADHFRYALFYLFHGDVTLAQKNLKPDGKALGQRAERLRQERNLSQIELARLAEVSARSIKTLEGGKIPRSDTLIRLSSFFGESPREWLRLAGLVVADAKIEQVLRRQRANRTAISFRPFVPAQYFEMLESQITPGTPALMVCVVLSRMTLRGEDNRARTSRLLANGLRVALAVPFPVDKFPPRIVPSVQGFYSSTFGHACDLAKELDQMTHTPGSGQVKVFKPLHDRVMLVQPPLLVNEVRPCMTSFYDKNLRVRKQELSIYARFTDGRPDRWTLVDPENGIGEERLRAEEAVTLWRGYVSEILEAWTLGATSEKNKIKDDVLANWEEQAIVPPMR
jgi:transcriptional regulator with XRE-family HTH domain